MSSKPKDEHERGRRAGAFHSFQRKLQTARATVQEDAEAYMAVWDVVESIGKYLIANPGSVPKQVELPKLLRTLFPDGSDSLGGERGLQTILDNIFQYSSGRASDERMIELQEAAVLSYVRLHAARIAHVHEGAISRNFGVHAVRLSLAMEEALMRTKLDAQSVESCMVQEPVVAQPWQTVSEIRVALLSGGYSALPYWWQEKGCWYFVRDISVVRYRRKSGIMHRKLSSVVVDPEESARDSDSRAVGASAKSKCPDALDLDRAQCSSIVRACFDGNRLHDTSKSVKCLLAGDDMKGLPVLVVDQKCCWRLLGIITPHDLLV